MTKKKVRKKKKATPIFRNITLTLTLLLGGLLLAFYLKKAPSEKQTFSELGTFVIRGIDLSHHNAIPEPRKLKNEGVSFVYMKATEGTDHLDRNYQLNYRLLKDAGIRTGAYHFYTFGVSGKRQAAHFIKTARMQSQDMIPAIDVEHSPVNPYSRDTAYVAKVIRELKALEDELYRYYGKKPIIYTNKNCYQLYIEKHFPDNLLWFADLHNQPSAELQNWRIWQFSHQGKVAGVDGKVDLNYYRYNLKEFDEMLLP